MLPDFVYDNLGVTAAVLIVVIGLLVIGLGDLLRFSPTRVWAISTVSFRQAIRRRVLWITPLVIVGVVVVSQLQKAVDAQDAIRQTTMFCLFATGMLVVLVTIILACTNLPREIESRVIYTVATKPTSRLEIVVGKIVGFVRVSFWMLVIMGVFTYGYVTFRDWRMRAYIADQLATPGAVEAVNRPTLEYYRDYGTLHARVLGLPTSLSILSHLPAHAADRWIPGMVEGEILASFTVDRTLIPAPDPQESSANIVGPTIAPPKGGLLLELGLRVEKSDERTPEEAALAAAAAPSTAPAGPTTSPTTGPATAPAAAAVVPPRISVMLYNSQREVIASPTDLGGAADGWEVQEGAGTIRLYFSADLLSRVVPLDARYGHFYIVVIGQAPGWKYGTDEQNVSMIVPETGHRFRVDRPLEYTGRGGQYGRQLRGGRDSRRVAMYHFPGVEPTNKESHQFEMRLGVERLEEDVATKLNVRFVDGSDTHSTDLFVETNRPTYFNVPASVVDADGYWVVLRTESNAWLGLQDGRNASLRLVKQDQSFAWNLLKSLTVLWLMSLLVTIVSIFCSTFLSWPIAVVLTVMILSGRWATEMIGTADGSVGRQVVNDMLGRDAGAVGARAVSESVDALVRMLHVVSQVLPDLSAFRAIEDLEQGIAISPRGVLLPSLLVALGFGIPLTVLAYVFLKFKEVAP